LQNKHGEVANSRQKGCVQMLESDSAGKWSSLLTIVSPLTNLGDFCSLLHLHGTLQSYHWNLWILYQKFLRTLHKTNRVCQTTRWLLTTVHSTPRKITTVFSFYAGLSNPAIVGGQAYSDHPM
jgi:hypothetical protein